MPWPPVPPSTGFVATGLTTIVWGTDGFVVGGTALQSYIVKSVRNSQRVEEAKVENGSGLTATEILLVDGYDYEVTVVDQSNVVAPVVGQIVSLQTPFFNAPIQFEVVNNSYNSARKQDNERVLLCRAFVLFPNFTFLGPL